MVSVLPSTEQVLSPSAFVHIVLRTSVENFKPMIKWYKTVLGAHPTYENDFMSFLTYDEEHHRIAIVAVPQAERKAPSACGLHHTAFSFPSLKDLALSYQQRKAHDIVPYWCVNHGVTTSMYYKDPDGNSLETQVDNLTKDEAVAYMMSEEFAENPRGVEFDAEEFVQRVESGEDEVSIKTRPYGRPRRNADDS